MAGITHSTVATGADEAGKEVNKDQWNDAHVITETGGQALSIGAVADGKFLKRNGTSLEGNASGDMMGYTVTLGLSGSATPADSTTYYHGILLAGGYTAANDTWAENHFEIAVQGTIKAISFAAKSSGTLASSENVTVALRINDTTNIASSSEARWDVAFETWTMTGLSTAVAVGDKIALIVTTPAWATNPTVPSLNAVVHIGGA